MAARELAPVRLALAVRGPLVYEGPSSTEPAAPAAFDEDPMSTLHLPHPTRRSRLTAIAAAVLAVLLAGYIMLLNHEERVMDKYYQDLRTQNLDLYLAKIMQARGFRRFLDEYVATHDYSNPIEEVPPFLIGRWALFDKAKRVSDAFVPDACVQGLEIEDGQLKLFGDGGMTYAAAFTMEGKQVTAHLAGTDKPATIDVIGYGSHLHHIEVNLPDGKGLQYGYQCR